ncbi:GNAT family N-acetyltransferase [Desulfosporosinus fructosivorans]
MLSMRRAKPYEYEILTDIAIKSEAYWGMDSDYMEKFKSVYKVTEEFISNNPTFVIEEDDSVVGFYGILIDDRETSLEYLFIEPKSIGRGYGKLLWNHLVNTCKYIRIKELVIVTSPQAKEFYLKMGAIFFGEVESLLQKGRIIPRLIYSLQMTQA